MHIAIYVGQNLWVGLRQLISAFWYVYADHLSYFSQSYICRNFGSSQSMRTRNQYSNLANRNVSRSVLSICSPCLKAMPPICSSYMGHAHAHAPYNRNRLVHAFPIKISVLCYFMSTLHPSQQHCGGEPLHIYLIVSLTCLHTVACYCYIIKVVLCQLTLLARIWL